VVLSLAELPRYVVLEPVSTVRFEVELMRPACEIDVALDAPAPGRSFLLLVGPQGGPVLQRIRLSGRARLMFEPRDARRHVLLLANPQKEPIVLRLRGRARRSPASGGNEGRSRRSLRVRAGGARSASRASRPPARVEIVVGRSAAGTAVGARRPRPKA